MGQDALEKTLATLAGQSLEEYRKAVMAKHIFGRLHVVDDSIMGDLPILGNGQKAPGAVPDSDLLRDAK